MGLRVDGRYSGFVEINEDVDTFQLYVDSGFGEKAGIDLNPFQLRQLQLTIQELIENRITRRLEKGIKEKPSE